MPHVPEKNIDIKSITIGKRSGQKIDIIGGQESKGSSIAFDMLSINEDINEPFLSGSLSITDSNNLLEQLDIRAGDPVIFTLDFINPTGPKKENIERVSKVLVFNIIDIINLTDPANQKVQGQSGTPVKLMIRFGSKTLSYLNFFFYVKEDLIGPISNEYSEESPFRGKNEETTPITNVLEAITPKCIKKNTTTKPIETQYIIETDSNIADWPPNTMSIMGALVYYINDTYNDSKPLVSDASFNDAWIKPYNNYYPAFKTSKYPYLINLINYIKENTVLKVTASKDLVEAEPVRLPKNPVVDFMFWEDLDQYNFKSLSKTVKTAVDKNNISLFYLDSDTNDMGSVSSMEVLNDYQLPNLLANGTYASEYVHVKPNWKSPYRNALSANEQFVKTLVRYSYTSDVWKSDQQKKQNNPVIAAEFNVSPSSAVGYALFDDGDMGYIEFPNNLVTIGFGLVDNNFGYFDETIYHSNNRTVWWEFINDGAFKFDITNTENSVSNPQRGPRLYSEPKLDEDETVIPTILNYPGITYHGGRYETERWQAHHDLSELPGSILYKINYGIKWNKDLLTNRKLYGEKKELKEKWKFYKENICCERKVPENFFALITKAEKIWGSGATAMDGSGSAGISPSFDKDQSGIYAYNWVEVEFWPRSDVYAILQNGEEIIKFDNHEMYPFVFVRPRGALEGHGILKRKYTARQDDPEDPNYNTINGQTLLNRSDWIDKEYFTKDLRAYNLNEILNTLGITLGGYTETTFAGMPVNAFKECSTLISNPGISTKGHKISVESDSACNTTYPSKFKMMPVGNFRIVGKCNSESVKEDWGFGRIVQMHAIPKDIMQTFGKVQDYGLTLSLPLTTISGTPQYNSTRKPTNEKIKIKTKTGEKEIELESRTEIMKRLEPEPPAPPADGEDPPSPSVPPLVDTKLIPQHEFFHQSPYMFVFDVENAHDGLCDGSCPI